MNKEIIYSEDYTVAYMAAAGGAIINTDVKTLVRPTVTVDKIAQMRSFNFWGDGNDFPQLRIAEIEKDPELGTLLNDRANLNYAQGIEYGLINQDGTLDPLPDALFTEVQQFLKKTNIQAYLKEISTDLEWFYNAYVEVVLSVDRSKILQLAVQAAEEVRLAKQNPATGLIDLCYINAQWPNGTITDPFTKQVPVLDRYYDPAAQLKAITSGTNFIYPVSIPTPGKKFYQLAQWNSIVESGWLEVSQLIPKFKKGMLTNQMTIKYHIQISNQYWIMKFDGWETKKASEKKAIKEAELDMWQKALTGAEKTGKSVFSVFHSNIDGGKDNDLIKITPIDDLHKEGKFLEDGKDASLKKISAVGLHPALTGMSLNEGMNSGGSDIREAYNLHVLKNTYVQSLLVEPLNNLVVEYNGWDPRTTFRIKNMLMTTLDAGKEGVALNQKKVTKTKTTPNAG